MKVWGITDMGLVRRENQDAYAIETMQNATVAVVCDGMGGVNGGQIASSIAVKTYMDVLRENLSADLPLDSFPEISRRGVKTANEAIRARAGAEANLYQMGTTLVSAIYRDGMALFTNVGDSRAYRANADGLHQITHDHSMVERMVELGDISPQQAKHHPNRNIITRALGPDETVEADTFAIPVAKGEYLLLCSDGLVNTVSDQEILFEIIHASDSDSCLNRLLDISKQRGASDNVTIVLMQAE
jgi:serine/threonine protein phosphatase PrpC